MRVNAGWKALVCREKCLHVWVNETCCIMCFKCSSRKEAFTASLEKYHGPVQSWFSHPAMLSHTDHQLGGNSSKI